MSLPLKDLGRLGVRSHTHKVLTRIARKDGMKLQELARQVLDDYVRRAVHDAKVVLGQDADNPDDTEVRGNGTEEQGTVRRGAR